MILIGVSTYAFTIAIELLTKTTKAAGVFDGKYLRESIEGQKSSANDVSNKISGWDPRSFFALQTRKRCSSEFQNEECIVIDKKKLSNILLKLHWLFLVFGKNNNLDFSCNKDNFGKKCHLVRILQRISQL